MKEIEKMNCKILIDKNTMDDTLAIGKGYTAKKIGQPTWDDNAGMWAIEFEMVKVRETKGD